jgi:hypothetical protein
LYEPIVALHSGQFDPMLQALEEIIPVRRRDLKMRLAISV